ncbi:dihydrofolate reductase family protein [Mucilaginibacter psychrotolerans]|uniref:Dihydrofolate reductase n=1 Tax=Mucilaginibacter psychrotolerans TaxID=1524096 RepID=A0A4Y8SHB2_9SPHI|nr:dihydrofolate reductase family protein [Mucilaginibacter psychrotolerans]TFF38252.1 dihydrofolate reductase [Mucilaginibacter psychrotolerans]
MRKLIVSLNLSLNGCMADPDGGLEWHHNHWSEEMARALTQQLADADTILLGRITYQAMAIHWQAGIGDNFSARQEMDFADMMRSCTKVVVSGTLANTGCWPNTVLINGDLADRVTALKQQSGKNIIVFGSGTLVDALARLGLVDEYRLWLHPVIISVGRPLFSELSANLQLMAKQAFETGVLLLCYRPV